jgi:hypothetical protein
MNNAQIVVGVDGSHAAQQALIWAAAEGSELPPLDWCTSRAAPSSSWDVQPFRQFRFRRWSRQAPEVRYGPWSH